MKEQQAITAYLRRRDLLSFSPSVALIDMDGTLYDSMPLHARAWHRLMSEQGIECTEEEFYMYEGRTGVSTINLLFNRAFGRELSPDEAKELYRMKTVYFNEFAPPQIMPGAQKMVAGFLSHAIPTVLVTGSGQRSLIDRLEHDFPGAFPDGRRVTSHDVTHGKPHPEPFLRGMELVGASPENSIAVDNAPLGVMAGYASGAFTIGVTTGPVPRQSLVDAGADIVYDSMPEMAERLPILLDLFKTSI